MRVHLDHNATTPLRPEARACWIEVSDALRGNPSSLHAGGRAARAIVDEARERVAAALGVHEEEIFFTSGGTESNHLALHGGLRGPGPLVTTPVEHSSVLETVRALGAEREVRWLPVGQDGVPEVDESSWQGHEPPALVSIMSANNETGAITDVSRVRETLENAGLRPTLHTDAVQALGRLPLDLTASGADLASFSLHKVGGPVGVGVLWRRRGTPFEPVVRGGGQEQGVRPGTENVAGIAAGALALELAVQEQPTYAERTAALTRALWSTLLEADHELRLLGPAIDAPRLPNTLCVRLPQTDGRVLVTRLDLEGVEASAGSACASGSLEPSHVLRAMGYDDETARSGLRLSLGRTSSRDECDHAARVLKKLVAASRAS